MPTSPTRDCVALVFQKAACCLFVLATVVPVRAQQAKAQATEARQFDFWLGDRDVSDPQGKVGGHSRIESIAEGNGLLENWTDADGTTGKSLNVYNLEKKRWQQFWVGNGTPLLELSGGLVRGSMVLSGRHRSPGGSEILDRITWTPNGDGSVRQFWETSADDGRTWRSVFEGIYRHPRSP
jgi:hypothetical protein